MSDNPLSIFKPSPRALIAIALGSLALVSLAMWISGWDVPIDGQQQDFASIPEIPPMPKEKRSFTEQAIDAIDGSQRLTDVLAYIWLKDNRVMGHKGDLPLLMEASEQIDRDESYISFSAQMKKGGIENLGVATGNGSYTIFERLTLPFSPGSIFEDGIDGASFFLPGELVRPANCTKDHVPVIYQAEAYPIHGKPVGLKLEPETPYGYRVTAPELTADVFEHRLVVKAACRSSDAVQKLK